MYTYRKQIFPITLTVLTLPFFMVSCQKQAGIIPQEDCCETVEEEETTGVNLRVGNTLKNTEESSSNSNNKNNDDDDPTKGINSNSEIVDGDDKEDDDDSIIFPPKGGGGEKSGGGMES